ncbi:hypothetical protein YDYSY3_37990 [Paenibacillus chitinolyticus]|uniref:hypothetical protein n=1 Tax=Paenibacillus chitinolyticus TaxID=79263 RepID=UPI0026E49A4A|nr:hypothetical protein [Paenibacillus chitinolyticus]GKS12799.1 hypothetical protein YDYSY3_37990 [Paenibacillus chitinolyticus]
MIKKVSIKLSHSLIYGGLAIVDLHGEDECIDFDVLKGQDIQILVGGRGKRVSEHDAARFEKELRDLIRKHGALDKTGTYIITAS